MQISINEIHDIINREALGEGSLIAALEDCLHSKRSTVWVRVPLARLS
jgi:hypothetical protein